jgi:hypothetical protein
MQLGILPQESKPNQSTVMGLSNTDSGKVFFFFSLALFHPSRYTRSARVVKVCHNPRNISLRREAQPLMSEERSELVQTRINKATAHRQAGGNPFAHRWIPTHTATDILSHPNVYRIAT